MKEQLQAVRAVRKKGGRTHKLRLTVFPDQGGRPYILDVEPDDQGLVQIGDDKTFIITPGSVWEEDGKLRAIINDSNPATVNPQVLSGDPIVSPEAINGIGNNNFIEQFMTLARKKSVWRQGSTWAFIAIGCGILLMLLWQIKTIGDGLEQLEAAVRTVQVAAQNGATEAGHQRIAPGGQ